MNMYGKTVELRLFCEDPELDDEVIDFVDEYQRSDNLEVDDMSICINAGAQIPWNYKIALNILSDILKQLGREVHLSDFGEMIKNKFFSDSDDEFTN